MNRRKQRKGTNDNGGPGLFLMVTGVALMSSKAFVPAASSHIPGSILLAIVMLILGGVILGAGIDKFVKFLMSSFALFLIPILYLLQSFILNDGNSFSNLLTLLMLIVYPMFSSYVIAHRYERKIIVISRGLLLYISALLVLTMVTTYMGNLEFPGASRSLAHYREDTSGLLSLYNSMNIGGFGFIYTVTLVLPLLSYWLKTNRIALVLSILGFVVAILCIISSQYTIALLMSFISVAMCFFPRRIRRTHIITFALLLLLLLISSPLIGKVFLYLSNNVDGKIMSARMEEVYLFFSRGEIGLSSDTATRIGHIRMSWNTFFSNPLIGSNVGAGNHSYLVDTLAHFGIVGLAAVVISFRCIYRKYVVNLKKTELYYYALACYLINIIQCYVNTYNGFVVFTLILPLYIVAFQDKIEKKSYQR